MNRLFWLAALLLLAMPAMAATPDKPLTDYKAEIEQKLQSLYAQLSPEGKQATENSQKQWLAFVESYCAEKNLHWRYKKADDCILDQYKNRAFRLKDAVPVITKEGLVIRRMEYFAAETIRVSEDMGEGYEKWLAEIYDSWPQIDNPASEQHRQWNEAMAKGHPNDAEIEGHNCDYLGTYKIVLATPNFISVDVDSWNYCNGAAHGWDSGRYFSRLLHENRDITAQDIFKDNTGWEDALAKLSSDNLVAQGKSSYDPKKLKRSPWAWEFLPDSLQIHFGQLSGYAGGDHVAVIPWQELRPYMQKTSLTKELTGE